LARIAALSINLAVGVHTCGASSNGDGSSKVKTPTMYVCGETDSSKTYCDTDFQRVGDQPTFYSWLTGVDHITCARKALPGMVSWLRWHLLGESERKIDFTKPNGMFYQDVAGTKWNSDTKNWERLPD
jgi:hypothetical protein